MSDMEKRIYTIYGSKKDLNTLEKLLRHMEFLGNIGASRNLLVRVDGDGFGQIKVKNHRGEPLDNEFYNTKQGNDEWHIVGKYDIG